MLTNKLWGESLGKSKMEKKITFTNCMKKLKNNKKSKTLQP